MGITPCSRAMAPRAFTQTGWSFRHGFKLNSAPPSARNVCLPRIPISSMVSRQSTVNAGQSTLSLRTPERARRTSWSCVDGSSHLSLPSRDWKEKLYVPEFESSAACGCDRCCGNTLPAITGLMRRAWLLAAVLNLETMAPRRVRLQDVTLRNAMETEQEMVVGLQLRGSDDRDTRASSLQVVGMIESRRHHR